MMIARFVTVAACLVPTVSCAAPVEFDADIDEPVASAAQSIATTTDQCAAMGEDACRMQLIAELGDQGMHLSHSAKWTGWFSPNEGAYGPGRPGKGAVIFSRMNNEPARIFAAANYGDVYVASVLTQWSFTRPGYIVVKDEESLSYDFKGDVLPP